jgi:hypothetical protein
MRLDKELNRAEPQDSQYDPLESVYVFEEYGTEHFRAPFSRWLLSGLKVGTDPDEESIELRFLIRSIAHRLAAVTQLHE